MAEISFHSILDGVILALHAAFPPPVQIYGGDVRQGLQPGDFNVVMPAAGQTHEVGRRYRRTPTVDVLYYPREEDGPCCRMAERLTGLLERIVTPEGDVVYATDCRWTVTNGVLHVLAAYTHFVYCPREEVKMEQLQWSPPGFPGAAAPREDR